MELPRIVRVVSVDCVVLKQGVCLTVNFLIKEKKKKKNWLHSF